MLHLRPLQGQIANGAGMIQSGRLAQTNWSLVWKDEGWQWLGLIQEFAEMAIPNLLARKYTVSRTSFAVSKGI